jgi:hypothetical protein
MAAGGHDANNSLYRRLGQIQQKLFWQNPARLTCGRLMRIFAPLRQLNLERTMTSHNWPHVLRYMMAHVCFCAWAILVDRFNPGGQA